MYEIRSGDTFAIVSRNVYGDEAHAEKIAQANPGVLEPLAAGTILSTPRIPDSPRQRTPPAPASDKDEVAIELDGVLFRFWTDATITLTMDAPPTVSFSAPFQVDDPAARENFRPFSYKAVNVSVGGDGLFSGVAVEVAPTSTINATTARISAYGLPGVLGDCTAPASMFPLEFNGQTLEGIAKTLTAPFGLSAVFIDGAGSAFDRVALTPTDKIWSFLTVLAQQRGLLITADADGAIVFQKERRAGQPVARLSEGSAPLVSVSPQFNPQEYYSHITGIEPAGVDTGGAQFTAVNPFLSGVIRPLTFTVSDAKGGDLKEAVQAKLGRMIGGMVSYTVDVATWRTPAGELWTPNTTVSLIAPGAMIYKEHEFLIRSVSLYADSGSNAATLTLVLPGVFGGELPGRLPWDE